MSAQLIKNGRLVMETRVIDGGAVLIEDGKIARIYDKTPDLSGERLNVIDAGGLYVSPASSTCMSTAAGDMTSCAATRIMCSARAGPT